MNVFVSSIATEHSHFFKTKCVDIFFVYDLGSLILAAVKAYDWHYSRGVLGIYREESTRRTSNASQKGE